MLFYKEFGFEIIYRPLLDKKENTKVTLKSPELGDYVYSLSLEGISATVVTRSMSFKAALGSDTT